MVDPIFFDLYERGRPPWDIGQAQPAFVELAEAGMVKGSVMDLGCGTGDLVLEMAERGHDAWGIDAVPKAIDRARGKAKARHLDATFLVGDVLELEHLGVRFGTILDCGLFHTLSDRERVLYANQITSITRKGGWLHVMAFSDWEDKAWGGPRRVSQQELLDTFQDGWTVEDIQQARFLTAPTLPIRGHAWLASFRRTAPATRRDLRKEVPPLPVPLDALVRR